MKRLLLLTLALICGLVARAAWRTAHERQPSFARPPRMDAGGRAVGGVAPLRPEAAAPMKGWDRIEDKNPARFIANLRAVGCPEQTIRDILTLRIGRAYRDRLVAMEAEAARRRGFVRNPSRSERREAQKDRVELRNAMQSEMESLLGENAMNLIWTVLGIPERVEADLLPLEKRAKVRDVEAQFDDLPRLAAETAGGFFPGGDRADAWKRRQELERQEQAALAGILTPAELEEYQMRKSAAADYVRNYLPAAGSEAEFRAMVKVAAELEMSPDDSDKDASFQERLKAALGEQRVGEQQEQEQAAQAQEEVRRLDQQWEQERQRIATLAQSAGVSEDDANRFSDRLKELVPSLKTEFDQMQKGLGGTPEENEQRMEAAVRAELERVAVETVGENGRALVQKMMAAWARPRVSNP
jgi:hypothetical protein